jgi:hypothetical protein
MLVVGRIMIPQRCSCPNSCNLWIYIILHGQGRIKVTDNFKVANQLFFRWGDYSAYLDRFSVTTEFLKVEEDVGSKLEWCNSRKSWFKIISFEEGGRRHWSIWMFVVSRSWKRQGNWFSNGVLERKPVLLTLWVLALRLCQTSDLQDCKIINLCCFKSSRW